MRVASNFAHIDAHIDKLKQREDAWLSFLIYRKLETEQNLSEFVNTRTVQRMKV